MTVDKIDGSSSPKRGKILVFSAASGAGKTTILDRLRKAMPELRYSISATTRSPRPHEIHGTHYFFMSVEEFKKKIGQKAFAEWAIVHGNYYGTPRSFVDETINRGFHLIMDIDVYGKITFDTVYPEAIGIFIKPPSMQELERRLRSRNTDSESVIALRLANAEKEMAFAEERGTYEYTIINDDLEETIRKVIELVKKLLPG